jgi:hypothetical protein
MFTSSLHQQKFRQHTIQVDGPDLKIETSQRNQQVYIDLREYFQVADSADFLPSRRGIHLPVSEAAKFVTALKDMQAKQATETQLGRDERAEVFSKIHAKIRQLVSQCCQGCIVDDPSQIPHLDGCLKTLTEADYYGYLLELSNNENIPLTDEEEEMMLDLLSGRYMHEFLKV